MAKPKLRLPAVAGQFYESDPAGLKKQVESLIEKNALKADCLACILPHAGYIYSGSVAGRTVSSINVKERALLLGPNHTGMGSAFSIMADGAWKTPLGKTEIDSDFARALLEGCEYLVEEPRAHACEHSLEVELPFLQYFKTGLKIIPIAILCDDLDALKKTGADIAKVIEERGLKDSTLIVASSDMTHYEPQDEAVEKDKQAIQAILELDEDRLMEKVRDLDISMCGYAPVTTMLSCVKRLGAKSAKLILYQTSGDVTGDKSSVVGYAGITVQ